MGAGGQGDGYEGRGEGTDNPNTPIYNVFYFHILPNYFTFMVLLSLFSFLTV